MKAAPALSAPSTAAGERARCGGPRSPPGPPAPPRRASSRRGEAVGAPRRARRRSRLPSRSTTAGRSGCRRAARREELVDRARPLRAQRRGRIGQDGARPSGSPAREPRSGASGSRGGLLQERAGTGASSSAIRARVEEVGVVDQVEWIRARRLGDVEGEVELRRSSGAGARLDRQPRQPDSLRRGRFSMLNNTWNSGVRDRSRSGCSSASSASKGTSWCA